MKINSTNSLAAKRKFKIKIEKKVEQKKQKNETFNKKKVGNLFYNH